MMMAPTRCCSMLAVVLFLTTLSCCCMIHNANADSGSAADTTTTTSKQEQVLEDAYKEIRQFMMHQREIMLGGDDDDEADDEDDDDEYDGDDSNDSVLLLRNKVKDVMHLMESSLEPMKESLEKRQEQIHQLLHQSNAMQFQHFLQERLEPTLQQMISMQQLWNNHQRQLQLQTANQEEKNHQKMKQLKGNGVTLDKLKSKFNAENIIAESDQSIMSWAFQLVREEKSQVKEDLVQGWKEQQEKAINSVKQEDCSSISEVVSKVQSAVTKFSHDGIGLLDHLQMAGTSIVHSMTSPTYTPPPLDSELLGNVWWRKYIPQDWEQYLLPEGWQNWNTAIPSYFYHSLHIDGAKTAPPETILSKKNVPGSCWPMEGTHGQVTIRLPYPIHVETFTLDHVNARIVPSGTTHQTTAPKRIKVIAYPTCDDDEDNDNDGCAGLGFNVHDPMEIGQLEYDISNGQSVQTFNSVFVPPQVVAATKDSDDDDLLEQPSEQEEEEESCSTEAAACTTPPKINVGGITLKILDNHGNPDYTCLYRFRLHGEQVHHHRRPR